MTVEIHGQFPELSRIKSLRPSARERNSNENKIARLTNARAVCAATASNFRANCVRPASIVNRFVILKPREPGPTSRFGNSASQTQSEIPPATQGIGPVNSYGQA